VEADPDEVADAEGVEERPDTADNGIVETPFATTPASLVAVAEAVIVALEAPLEVVAAELGEAEPEDDAAAVALDDVVAALLELAGGGAD